MEDKQRAAIVEFVRSLMVQAGKSKATRKVSKGQSKLMRYSIECEGYRTISKKQTDEGLSTYRHFVNLYELKMNTRREKDWEDMLSLVLDGSKNALTKGMAKQMNIDYRLSLPNTSRIEILRKRAPNDLRVLNHDLLQNPESVAESFADFIVKTKPILLSAIKS
jgi:hypothetical protein